MSALTGLIRRAGDGDKQAPITGVSPKETVKNIGREFLETKILAK